MTMSRPRVTITRLTPRRALEPRESMNCKSCRKRKVGLFISYTYVDVDVVLTAQVKCNRTKPCEACRVFDCACIYGWPFSSPLVLNDN